jgi:hypothetical protein
MKITEVTDTPDDMCSGDYHILTFAETGFAVLSNCAKQFGLGWEITEQFSAQVNETDETGSLHPKAPISAVPRHVIRDNNDPDKLARYIVDFLEANERHIKAKRLLIDFRAGLAPFVTVACKKALKSASAGILVDVIIVIE